MARGRGRGRGKRGKPANQGSRPSSPPKSCAQNAEDNSDSDEMLGQALRLSQQECEKSEILRKKEVEDLQRAMDESQISYGQNGNKNDNSDSNDEFDSLIDSKASFSGRLGIDSSAGDSFSLQLSQDDTPPVVSNRGESSKSLPQNSGILTTSTPVKPLFEDLNPDDFGSNDPESEADPNLDQNPGPIPNNPGPIRGSIPERRILSENQNPVLSPISNAIPSVIPQAVRNMISNLVPNAIRNIAAGIPGISTQNPGIPEIQNPDLASRPTPNPVRNPVRKRASVAAQASPIPKRQTRSTKARTEIKVQIQVNNGGGQGSSAPKSGAGASRAPVSVKRGGSKARGRAQVSVNATAGVSGVNVNVVANVTVKKEKPEASEFTETEVNDDVVEVPVPPKPKPEVVTLDDSVMINETGDISVQEVAHEEIIGEQLPGPSTSSSRNNVQRPPKKTKAKAKPKPKKAPKAAKKPKKQPPPAAAKANYESDAGESSSDPEDDDDRDPDYNNTSALADLEHTFNQADNNLQTVERASAEVSQFNQRFWEVDGALNTSIQIGATTLQSIVTCRNSDLEQRFRQKRESFEVLNIPTTELYLFYNNYSGNQRKPLWNIVKKHFKPFRNHDGRADCGKGVYLFEKPDMTKCQNQGVVMCKVLVGNHHRIRQPEADPIPEGHHSKYVDLKDKSRGRFYVLNNPEQIWPIAVLNCGQAEGAAPGPSRREPTGGLTPEQEREKINKEMAKIFEKSLKAHLTGKYMKPCAAIITKLYPHQMYALSWMAESEIKTHNGVTGGILADDMGLGKTLTILALIMTNFHDRRPLDKPMPGQKRQLSEGTMKYLPTAVLRDQISVSGVGTTAKIRDFHSKDTKGRVKSSKRKYADEAFFVTKEAEKINDSELFLDDDSKDEFDSLIDSKASYSGRLGIDSSTEFFEKAKRQRFFDDLSDDDEYQNMTEEERNEKMAPKSMTSKLNLDGAVSFDDESSDEQQIVKRQSARPRKKTRKIESDNEDSDEDMSNTELPSPREDTESPVGDDFDFDIPDSMNFEQNGNGNEDSADKNNDMQMSVEQMKNIITPPSMPADRNGRRRATLIITPASLIGHWLEQIHRHVDSRVILKIYVQHGQNKTFLATELEDQDIVLTTYGTLQSEYKEDWADCGPMIKAKWLRVCLDEGHNIKNHLAKTAKAAARLDTKRKWIISGTPIQNNLVELWALLQWLGETNYGMNRKVYNWEIVRPINDGRMSGYYRLQFILDAVCIRRTKKDEIAPGKRLVTLPPKTVTLEELEFSPDEQIVYDAYRNKAEEIVRKYIRTNSALKNYAHIFAIMMRLRQLSCHRDLLPIQWNDVNMNDLKSLIDEIHQGEDEESVEDSERGKLLAEKLREMIREGISDECSICLGDFSHPVITPCAHVYCRPCIVQLIESVPPPAPCPLCRGPLEKKSLLEAAKSDDDEKIGENDEAKKEFEDIVVDVSSTKVNAVLKHLETIRRDTPGEKTIVVSQFTSLLSILQPLLDNTGIRFARLDGTMSTRHRSEVIGEFQDTSPSSPTVLLLSLRAGGVGLNLNVANHMLLLDPAWNPSTEEQCFDRIHRLGQTKPVTITRFVMKDSIEMKMLDIQERKKNLISGAFRQTEGERRQQRLRDIRDLFGITDQPANN